VCVSDRYRSRDEGVFLKKHTAESTENPKRITPQKCKEYEEIKLRVLCVIDPVAHAPVQTVLTLLRL
jgi:hypothetical protein